MSYADAYDPDAGVAIIALAGRFPGARDVEGFWRNLVEGRETISRFADEELEPARSSDMAARKEPDLRTRTRHTRRHRDVRCGVLQDVAARSRSH